MTASGARKHWLTILVVVAENVKRHDKSFYHLYTQGFIRYGIFKCLGMVQPNYDFVVLIVSTSLSLKIFSEAVDHASLTIFSMRGFGFSSAL